ncbi:MULTISPECIES: recombinase family protein [Gimesia]|uniref:Resolvase/invertase-type recombinase catalytic domain-containing protein n=1 Tax=Gimesia benthica TaxID=2608982 RepID=A0A6I6AJ80_9PLAN|nr:hypothetical protein F1728_27545 [Gimesia benthica]
MRSGNTLLVWKLGCLRRPLRYLATMIEELKEREIGFRSIIVGIIDTTTPSGELIFHVFSALDQFEQRLIQETTKTGLAAGDDDTATSNAAQAVTGNQRTWNANRHKFRCPRALLLAS